MQDKIEKFENVQEKIGQITAELKKAQALLVTDAMEAHLTPRSPETKMIKVATITSATNASDLVQVKLAEAEFWLSKVVRLLKDIESGKLEAKAKAVYDEVYEKKMKKEQEG